jgi:hypothetical protein
MEVNATPRPLYPREGNPVPNVQVAGWVPGSVWTGAANLATTGIPFPDRLTRRESLYRLRYPGTLILTRLLWDEIGAFPLHLIQRSPQRYLIDTRGIYLTPNLVFYRLDSTGLRSGFSWTPGVIMELG